MGYAVQYLVILALPLQRQKLLVALIQPAGQPTVFSFYQTLDLKKILFIDAGAVHLPSPFHQIMRLVDQKQILAFISLAEEPLQMRIGIKNIIIVADNRIHPQRHVQPHLERAHVPFSRLFFYHLPAHLICGGQQFIHRVIHPVKMPLGVRAVIRIAVCLLAEADLLLGGEHDHFHAQILGFQGVKCLPRHRSGNRLGRQVEYLLSQPFPHGFYSRKHRRDRLSHSCRSLYEQFLLTEDGAVDAGNQLLLSLPVRKGKFHLPYGCIALLSPLNLITGPSLIRSCQFLKPGFQILEGICAFKSPDLLRLHIAVGHLHANFLQAILPGIDIGVALCLGQMHQDGLFQCIQFLKDSLDLVHHGALRRIHDAVCTPLDQQQESIAGNLLLQGDLCMIIGTHLPLDLPVDLASKQHGVLVSPCYSIVNIAAAQYKFHQAAHGDPNHWLFQIHSPFRPSSTFLPIVS